MKRIALFALCWMALALSPAFADDAPAEETAPAEEAAPVKEAAPAEKAASALEAAAEKKAAEAPEKNSEETVSDDEMADFLAEDKPEAAEKAEKQKPPVSPQCLARCKETCACWFEKFGGGPFVMFLFNSSSTRWGDYTGPSVWVGGRGYGYFGKKNNWRFGGLGAGGSGTSNGHEALNLELYPYSQKREVNGGYGGVTAEYVFNLNKHVEIPMGLLLGGGGGTYRAELVRANEDVSGVKSVHEDSSGYLVLQPMVGVEANVIDWMKIAISASYVLAEPFGGERYISGFALMFGLNFGRFIIPDFKM